MHPRATRVVRIAGIRTDSVVRSYRTVIRNLTSDVDGLRCEARYLIIDNDSKFTADFGQIFDDAAMCVVRIAFQDPSMNAIAARWVRRFNLESLDKLILFGETSLRERGAYSRRERLSTRDLPVAPTTE